MTLPTMKKLLVLDVNGLLVETFHRREKLPKNRCPDGIVGKLRVYRRAYCNEFLTFCFENFEVGIWSSAQQHNVLNLVDFIFGDLKNKLVFCWHQGDCTHTGLRTLENKMKPVFLKELYKLWDKLKLDLPWEKGDFGPFNTLLIDDTPYKAMRNPPHTAIFPYPYKVSNEPDDALGGALLKYLEGISVATNVQQYVECHRFGQPPISKENPNWDFYHKILFIRLPIINQNSDSVVRTKMNGVDNKAPISIAYNSGVTQSSSIQEGSVPILEREKKKKRKKSKKKKRTSVLQATLSQEHESHNISPVEEEAAFGISQHSDLVTVSKDNGLSEKAVTCMIERNGAITTLSQKYATLNGLEENGVHNAKKVRKKMTKSVMQAAVNQEHGAHNISLMMKESAFGIPQRSDLDMVSKDDGLFQTAVTCTTERNGAIITTLSRQHATPHVLEENCVAEATKPKKKNRKSAMQAALNQEHGALNISLVDKEAAFGISQRSDLHMVSKDDGLSETAVTCSIERNGVIVTTLSQKHDPLNGVAKATCSKKEKRKSVMEAAFSPKHGAHNISPVENEAAFANSTCMTQKNCAIVTTSSQKHATHNGLEESGVAKAKKPRKKKRKISKQPALNQEHGAPNISPMEKEAAFGISQQFDLDLVSKEDGVPDTALTCTEERHGAIVTTSSQKHSTLNRLEESGAAKTTKPGKKKRKGAEQATLNQEHGAHIVSRADKEAAFGISQQSDLHMVSKEDDLPETAVTCSAGRHGGGQAALNREHGTHNISPVDDVGFGIPQRSYFDMLSEDDGLFETAVTCTSEGHDANITTLSRKQATLNELEGSGMAKATKPRKIKRKSAEQAASNQEHGAHNISPVEIEAAFGISQKSDLDPVSKEDDLPEIAMTCTAERHDAIISTLNRKHATLNELEESGVAKSTKSSKTKRKSVEQAALSREHGAQKTSPAEKEAAFGISKKSELDPVPEEDCLPEMATTCTADRHGAILTPLIQKHATLNGLEESGAARASKSGKKKRKGVKQAALNQELGAHNEEAAFCISQRSDFDMKSKADELFETAVTCTTERNGAIITTLSRQHDTLNGLEETDVAKATKTKKKKRIVMHAALSQEHGAQIISRADKEAAFVISQQSGLHVVSKEDGLPETAMTCTAERHGAIVTTLSQKHATRNGLEESGAAKATKPGKKKSAEQAAPNQESGAHIMEKAAVFGISQKSDLDLVSKEDVLPDIAVTCTTERHGARVTTLNQKHATLIGLEESDTAKATKPRKKNRKAV